MLNVIHIIGFMCPHMEIMAKYRSVTIHDFYLLSTSYLLRHFKLHFTVWFFLLIFFIRFHEVTIFKSTVIN